jgi:phosphatidylglycerol:prolipoprotein diacylglycerol transferase
MINFLHTFSPERVLLSVGPVTVYWYGLLIISGILSGMLMVLKIGEKHGLKKEDLFDIAFWLIIGGIIGARIYHAALEAGYYYANPLKIFALWEGGLAIHGAIFADIIILLYFCRKLGLEFWKIASVFSLALPLGQAIGRWGNYFNQELFGFPTDLPWGIPIKSVNRPENFLSSQFFHPTFLYESMGSLIIFAFVLLFQKRQLLKPENRRDYQFITLFYLCSYSLLRFMIEFLRIDSTPVILGLRFPQLASLAIAASCFLLFAVKFYKKRQLS